MNEKKAPKIKIAQANFQFIPRSERRRKGVRFQKLVFMVLYALFESWKQIGLVTDYSMYEYYSDINEPDIVIQLTLVNGRIVTVGLECKNWNQLTWNKLLGKLVPVNLTHKNYSTEIRHKFFNGNVKKPFNYCLVNFRNPIDTTYANPYLTYDHLTYVDYADLMSTFRSILEAEYGGTLPPTEPSENGHLSYNSGITSMIGRDSLDTCNLSNVISKESNVDIIDSLDCNSVSKSLRRVGAAASYGGDPGESQYDSDFLVRSVCGRCGCENFRPCGSGKICAGCLETFDGSPAF